MLDLYAFYLLAPLTVISALLIFVQKKLVRAVIALSGAFLGSALLFLLLGQTLIAILMLIIFIGGLSTYLIVAVATEEKNIKLISLEYFGIIAAVFFAFMVLLLVYLPAQASAPTPNFLNAAASAFQYGYPTLYIVVILLFSVTIAGTLIIKKFAKLIV